MTASLCPNLTEPETEKLLEKLRSGTQDRTDLKAALLLRGEPQQALFALARARREGCFPENQVEIRSVIELSNICHQSCKYCSMAKGSGIKRYMITKDAVLAMADFLYANGRRVILLQSGENGSPNFVNFVTDCVQEIKTKHPEVEIILCLGNLTREQYQALRAAGADRYVLKFETANEGFYADWKQTDTLPKRLECLETLLELGFKVGTGNMVGMPGQTLDHIVDDLMLVGKYNLAMMSCTVFIPGEACVFRDEPKGDVETALNFIALMRILYPSRLMPTTSCLEQAKPGGLLAGLMAGANTVTMHDGTPEHFAALFPIYSSKRVTPNKGLVAEILAQANLTAAPGPLR